MYSKRQLYKPAPKQNVGQKKVRKLVQGTLDSTNLGNPIPMPSLETEIEDPTRSKQASTDINDNNSWRNARRFVMAHPDVQDDPSMSQMRSVPALTEYASPRAEPPSRCLDLSDTELNLSAASSPSTARRQQPIMVCDASHLGSSPDNTEVEVLVEYEDSPARVICHTPNRADVVLASKLEGLSPRNTTGSALRRGPISLQFDSPKAVVSHSRNSTADNVSHDMIPCDNVNRESDIDRKVSRGLLISESSRGIIKEILAEEMGSRDCSSLSLYSHGSPPPARSLPRSSSPVQSSRHYPTPATINSNLSPRNPVLVEKTPPKSKDIPKAYAAFESDSDSNKNTSEVGRIDRTPKIEAAKKVEILKHQNDSDSETCSLYEYVTQKNRGSTSKEKSSGQGNKSQNVVSKPSSAKKKPGRIVASRFMQSTNATKNNTSSLNSTKGSTNTSSHSNVTKPKIMTAKAALKPSARVNRQLNSTKSSPPVATSAKNKHPDKKSRFTSTPTQDDSCYPYEIDASSILPSDTMALSDRDGSDSDHVFQRSAGVGVIQKSRSKASKDEVTSFQQDIHYARYIQASFLSAQAKQLFKDQEKQAMEQLHGLWNLHEKKRFELAKSKTELQRLKTLVQIDSALDNTQSQLSSLEEKLPQVGAYYTNLCSTLNNTRHQIATKDIYIPNKTEEERETYEDRLEATLRESEHLLKEISSKTGNAFPSMHQYVASVEAIKENVEESGNELRQSYRDLDVAHGLCSQFSSRMVMPML